MYGNSEIINMDKLKAERKTAYPFSALADPSANKWFKNQKTW